MGYSSMRQITKVKTKNIITKRNPKRIILTIIFIFISLGVGAVVTIWGNNTSYIESNFMTAIITLFGFGLTSTVFIYQALENKQNVKTRKVIRALAGTLLLTFILIILSLIFDFIENTVSNEVAAKVMKGLEIATLCYAFICLIDILCSFVVIIKNKE